MGVFENPKTAEGTLSIARAVASANAFSIVGGGDSAAAVIQSGIADRISHISTGGGASLEFLSGRKLPGVEVPDGGRKLRMRRPVIAGNWKMFKTAGETGEFFDALLPPDRGCRSLRHRRCAPVYRTGNRGGEGPGQPCCDIGAEPLLGRAGGLHGGDFRIDARRCRLPLCHHRAFRAQEILRRDRRRPYPGRFPQRSGRTSSPLSVSVRRLKHARAGWRKT